MAPGIQTRDASQMAAAAKDALTPSKKIDQLSSHIIDMASGDQTMRTMFGAKVDNTDT